MNLFKIKQPSKSKVPILLSIPHSGTYFPENIKANMQSERVEFPDDTDWFIPKLYEFATDLGITMIVANYSRWVIDLNRDATNKPLYDDGRVITDVVTVTDFNGNPIYKEDYRPDAEEIKRRADMFYHPYHQKIGEILNEFKDEFGKALLFDAHSIRKHVPGIRPEPFPELILGDNDESSASHAFINSAVEVLGNSAFEFSHNHPFKGGYITRSFGNPSENIHALQLEMAKTNYMNVAETEYSEKNAAKIQIVLKELLGRLIEKLK